MKTHGLRGKWSPTKDATVAQLETIKRLRAECETNGVAIFELRYSSYIGPGCAADRRALTVSADGRIYAIVETDGTVS